MLFTESTNSSDSHYYIILLLTHEDGEELSCNIDINTDTLKSIYYALFESHVNYACIMCGKTISTTNCLHNLQKIILQIINFQECNDNASPLFHYVKVIN